MKPRSRSPTRKATSSRMPRPVGGCDLSRLDEPARYPSHAAARHRGAADQRHLDAELPRERGIEQAHRGGIGRNRQRAVACATTSPCVSVIETGASYTCSVVTLRPPLLTRHSAVNRPRAFFRYEMEKPVTIPWTPGGSPTRTASPLAISARLAMAIACTDAR